MKSLEEKITAFIEAKNENEIQLVKIETIDDVDINPDSNRYLGIKEKRIDIKNIYHELEKMEIYENELIEFFRNEFISIINKENCMMADARMKFHCSLTNTYVLLLRQKML